MSTPVMPPPIHAAAPDAVAAPWRVVIDVQAALLSQAGLRSGAAAFTRQLALRCDLDRASLGVVRDTRVDVVAHSSGAGGEPTAARIGAAMAEAVDQRASVAWPVPLHGAPAHPRITLMHRALAMPGGSAATVPLVAGGRAVAALTVERWSGDAISATEIDTLEQIAGLAAPLIDLMRRNERTLRERCVDALRARWQALRAQPLLRRAAFAGIALGLAVVALLPVEHRIGGRARLEGAVQRVLVAPADGFLRQVHARPGDRVHAGQPLIELAEQDLQLERQRWLSQMAQYETAYSAAAARADRAQLVINHSRAAEAEAQLALVDMKLERARIEAPFDGIVVRGDLSQSLGAPLQQGVELMTIAPRDRFRVIVEVDERDIAAVEVGQRGTLALSALPWDTRPLRVVRIAPMASALDGRNVFEVEAVLLDPPVDLRPGLQGSARIVAGERTLLWSGSQRLVDALRLTWWEWFG